MFASLSCSLFPSPPSDDVLLFAFLSALASAFVLAGASFFPLFAPLLSVRNCEFIYERNGFLSSRTFITKGARETRNEAKL